ncbi:coiled-coil domain-containing protein 42 homolog [Sebastes umbrosus]|uniref:coiled-coil domain-containing protein 42 homolog n=1 Tax=Sebastes umbrosus TaxID=72105 RepID=UPI00189C5B9E|nr:coiled-coil domain-containing protein 42 homolog [Sebastes umbrosus]
MAGGPPSRDCSDVLFDLQTKRQEEGELEIKNKELCQMFVRLQQRSDELHKEVVKAKMLHLSFDLFFKEEDAGKASDKAERKRKEKLQQELELKRLMVEHGELMDRKQELQHQIQKHSLYWDFMVRVVKMTKYDDVQALTVRLESLLHFRDHLYQRVNEAREQVDQQKKALLILEEQHHVLQLHSNNQLSHLQTKIEKTRSEALKWERKWSHIQETAAKKTLLLGQIKMVTLNLYENTEDMVKGEEDVDMNDTEKQLDKVKMFIQDHKDIVKQHQNPSQRHDGQKKDKIKPKKRIATHCKKECTS